MSAKSIACSAPEPSLSFRYRVIPKSNQSCMTVGLECRLTKKAPAIWLYAVDLRCVTSTAPEINTIGCGFSKSGMPIECRYSGASPARIDDSLLLFAGSPNIFSYAPKPPRARRHPWTCGPAACCRGASPGRLRPPAAIPPAKQSHVRASLFRRISPVWLYIGPYISAVSSSYEVEPTDVTPDSQSNSTVNMTSSLEMARAVLSFGHVD